MFIGTRIRSGSHVMNNVTRLVPTVNKATVTCKIGWLEGDHGGWGHVYRPSQFHLPAGWASWCFLLFLRAGEKQIPSTLSKDMLTDSFYNFIRFEGLFTRPVLFFSSIKASNHYTPAMDAWHVFYLDPTLNVYCLSGSERVVKFSLWSFFMIYKQ